jgi:hypothetical protein
MRRWMRASALALLLLAAACAPRAPRITTVQGPAGDFEADMAAARATVNAFLAQEARQTPAADTLLALGADFTMTGLRVTVRPRLAGFNGPGEVSVEEASAAVSGEFAWVELSYRFAGRTPDLAERARATVILERHRAGWRIRHVHSSMVERW